MNQPILEVKNLAKKFGGRPVISGVSFQVGIGEIYAYLGPNGAGKTTTIRILTGLSRFETGEVRIGGDEIREAPLACKSMFGLVPQQANLDSELTVEENLVIHGHLHHMPTSRIHQRIDELLDYMDMGDLRFKMVRDLSGGLKRRLVIARALLHGPKILFLDEPSSGLDPAIRRRLWGFIKKIKNENNTIFLTTHYIEEAEFLAGRVAFLDRGKIVMEDTHAARAIRASAFAEPVNAMDYLFLFGTGLVFFLFAFLSVNQAKS
jgi:ABC-2 type transport system ATP-binding protein